MKCNSLQVQLFMYVYYISSKLCKTNEKGRVETLFVIIIISFLRFYIAHLSSFNHVD